LKIPAMALSSERLFVLAHTGKRVLDLTWDRWRDQIAEVCGGEPCEPIVLLTG
jgi:hypothetical protein